MSDPNPVQMQINEAASQPEESILKTKPPRKPRPPLAPEVKAKLAENMRKVNEARIAAAKIKNEHKLDAKQAEIAKEANDRLAVIEKKKEQIAKLKSASQQLEPKTPKPKKSKKQVIVELSDDSDSTDSETDGEDEPEILYVAKKKQTRPRAKSDPSIVKPKKQNKPQAEPKQDESKLVVKFL